MYQGGDKELPPISLQDCSMGWSFQVIFFSFAGNKLYLHNHFRYYKLLKHSTEQNFELC